MSSYISYMGTDILDGGDLELNSLTAEEVIVTGDISVNGTVDGVDISALASTSADHETRITKVEGEVNGISGKFVDLTSTQSITGAKTFAQPLRCHRGGVTPGVIKMGMGVYGYITSTAQLAMMSGGSHSPVEIFLGTTITPDNINVPENDINWKISSLSHINDGRLVFTAGPHLVSNWTEFFALKNKQYVNSNGFTVFERQNEMYQNLKMFNSNIIMDAGKTVDGVDISELKKHVDLIDAKIVDVPVLVDKAVLIDNAQTITGAKTFAAATTYFNHITSQSGFIRAGSNVNNFVYLSGGTSNSTTNPAVVLTCRAAGTAGRIGFNTDMLLGEDYAITEPFDDKKLYFNKGQRFGSGTMMVMDGATNSIDILADRLKIAKNMGQVTSGIGVRTTNRAEQFLVSNGDNVSEIFFGSDVDGTGLTDINTKWGISSRNKSNGRLIFYRAPGYSGTFDANDEYKAGNYESIMEFQNTKNVETKRYDCVINMNKPVNINSDLTVTGNLNVAGKAFTQFYSNDNFAHLFGTARIRLSRSGRNVTMMIFNSLPFSTPASDIFISFPQPIPAGFMPIWPVDFLIIVKQNGVKKSARLQVSEVGAVEIWLDIDGATKVTNPLQWDTFSVSWIAA